MSTDLSLPTTTEMITLVQERIQALEAMPEELARTIGIPNRYRGKTLKGLRQEYAHKITAARSAVLQGYSVIFTGGIGAGKTHLALCLLWEELKGDMAAAVAEGNFREIYVHGHPEKEYQMLAAVDLAKEIEAWRPSYQARDERGPAEAATRPRVLLLDDFGFESRAEGTRQQMATLLDRRFRSGKQTLITTNLSMEEIAATLDDRIASRLVEQGIVVHLPGTDYRGEIQRALRESLGATAQK